MKNSTRSSIRYCGVSLPENVIKSDDIFDEIDMETKYGISNSWMSEKMGIKARRSAPPGTQPSELAIDAAEEAIAGCKIFNPDEIDLVIFCGIEKDRSEPATAHRINRKLGLKPKRVFDVTDACFGFIDGMDIADTYIKSGDVRSALIVTGEVQGNLYNSVIRQLKSGLPLKKARDMLGFLSLGDAGGAVVMSANHERDETGFDIFNNLIDSNLDDKCFYRPNSFGEYDATMKMSRMVAHGFKMHKQLLSETMKKLNWRHMDWLLSHQVGDRSLKHMMSLNLVDEDRVIKTYPYLGNTTSAGFATSYHKLQESGRIKSGDRAYGCFAGSGLVTGHLFYTF